MRLWTRKDSVAKLFTARAKSEDVARREFILNVLLVGVMAIFVVAVSYNLAEQLFGESNPLSLWTLLGILGFFVGLYAASKKGKSRESAGIFIATILLFSGYLGVSWGIDLPASILLHVLAITMAGVLISTRAAYITTGVIIVYWCLAGAMQVSGNMPADRSWSSVGWGVGEIAVASVILAVIATVAWLGNREIEKALKRAIQSEHHLRIERDQLEIRIAQRTEELRRAELDRMSQAYRFVEFGRLAGSIFHDLNNPLTAISLNIESLAKSAHAPQQVITFTQDIARAQKATAHMQKLMNSMRRHLAREGKDELFRIQDVLSEVVQVLLPYAQSRGVSIKYLAKSSVALYGDPVAFVQIITNILSNAVDSHVSPVAKNDPCERSVEIQVSKNEASISVAIVDNGSGISEDRIENIFEPFYSTKHESGGLGIGLPLAKRLLEKSFGGTLELKTEVGKGTAFTVHFPKQRS